MTAFQKRRTPEPVASVTERVSSLEQAVGHIQHSVETLTVTIQGGFKEIHNRIDVQNESQKPKVLQWAGWAAVLVLLIGMLGSGYVRDLNRIEGNVSQIMGNRVSKHDETQSVLIEHNTEDFNAFREETRIRFRDIAREQLANSKQTSENKAVIDLIGP